MKIRVPSIAAVIHYILASCRSQSRTRFLNWRRKCLRKSRSLDQSQIHLLDDNHLTESRSLVRKHSQLLDGNPQSESRSRLRKHSLWRANPPGVVPAGRQEFVLRLEDGTEMDDGGVWKGAEPAGGLRMPGQQMLDLSNLT